MTISSKEPLDDWDQFIVECFVTDMFEEGFYFKTRNVALYGGGSREKPEIYYQISSCQGDGASFEGEIMHYGKWFKAVGYSEKETRSLIRLARVLGLKLSVETSWRDQNMRIHCEIDYLLDPNHTLVQAAMEGIEAKWDEWCRDKAHQLYLSLRDEYEYQLAWNTAHYYVHVAAECRNDTRAILFNLRRARRVWTALNDAGSDVASDASDLLESTYSEAEIAVKNYRRIMHDQSEALRAAKYQGITYDEVRD